MAREQFQVRNGVTPPGSALLRLALSDFGPVAPWFPPPKPRIPADRTEISTEVPFREHSGFPGPPEPQSGHGSPEPHAAFFSVRQQAANAKAAQPPLPPAPCRTWPPTAGTASRNCQLPWRIHPPFISPAHGQWLAIAEKPAHIPRSQTETGDRLSLSES